MMTWTTPEGMTSPDWWEVGQDKKGFASDSDAPSSADSVDINFVRPHFTTRSRFLHLPVFCRSSYRLHRIKFRLSRDWREA